MKTTFLLAALAIPGALLVSTSAVCGGGVDGRDYEMELTHYKETTQAVVDKLRRNYLLSMPRDAQMADASVKYTIRETFGINAFARKGEIILTSGTSIYFDWMAEAMILAKRSEYTDCMTAYINTLVETTLENAEKESGEHRKEIGSPATYYLTEKVFRCPRPADRVVYTTNEQAALGSIVGASIDLLLLHELGHVALGHVLSAPHSKAESRKREADADAWAARTAGQSGVDITFAIPAFILLASLDPGKMELEPLLDHPMGGLRCVTILDITSRYLRENKEFSAELKKNGEYDAFWTKTQNTRRQLETLLHRN